MNNDNNIIQLAKNNNQDAINQLIKENEKMIHGIIKKYDLELGDYQISKEDLYQEGLIAIFEAIKDYKDGYNTKFSTFAYNVIKRRIYKIYMRQAEIYNEENYSYSRLENADYSYTLKTDYISDNPIAYLERSYYVDALNAVINDVDEIDKTILKMRAEDYTYDEIACKLSISNKLVDYRIRRLKKRLKNEKDKYLC